MILAIGLLFLIGFNAGINGATTGDPDPAPSPSPSPLPPSSPSPSPTPSSSSTGESGNTTGILTPTTGDTNTTGSGYNKYDYFGNFGRWLKVHFPIWWQGLLIALAMLFVLMVVVWGMYSCCIWGVCVRVKRADPPYEKLVGKVGDKK